ncbi:unnamed protein product [Phaeothamnion confervicola]
MSDTSLRHTTWLLTMCSILSCAGLVYGWAPMQVMLRDAGAFEGSDSQLTLVYALAAGALEFNGFFAGMLLDSVGPTKSLMLLSTGMVAGLILVASFPALGSAVLFPGFILCGLTGIGILLVGFAATSLVSPDFACYTIMLASCFFDSSTVVPLALSKGYGTFGSCSAVFGIYAAYCAVLLTAACVCWRRCEARIAAVAEIDAAAVSGHSMSSSRTPFEAAKALAKLAAIAEAENGRGEDENRYDSRKFRDASHHPAPADRTAVMLGIRNLWKAGRRLGAEIPAFTIEDLPVAHLPLRQQLLSREFLLSLVFYLVNVLKVNSYIGYLDQMLRDIDAPSNNSYQNILGGMIALGFLFVPVVDLVVGRTGLGWTAQIINAISVGYLAFLMTNKLWAQWPAVIIYAAYRAFVFGYPPLLALEVFGPATFGRISGLLFTIGGVPTLMAYPLTAWGRSGDFGGWRGVNGMLLASTLIAIVPAAWLQKHSVESAFHLPLPPQPPAVPALQKGGEKTLPADESDAPQQEPAKVT